MTLMVPICIIGMVLSVAPARAANFNAERDFVTRASIGNLFAIAESQLALDRTNDPRVTNFARWLVEDHGRAEEALQAAADGSGAKVPAVLDQDHQARMMALRSKSGADFNKVYVADQYEMHSNALTLYADYMLLGNNEKLRALAIKMIPITEAQLKGAQALSGN